MKEHYYYEINAPSNDIIYANGKYYNPVCNRIRSKMYQKSNKTNSSENPLHYSAGAVKYSNV